MPSPKPPKPKTSQKTSNTPAQPKKQVPKARRVLILFLSLVGAATLFYLIYQATRAQSQTYTQSGYRFLQNSDSLQPASPLAATNTPATLPAKGDPFRLRMLIHVGDEDLAAGEEVFKLQYAQKVGATCDTNMASTDESYQDVTPISALAYYDNPSLSDGDLALASTTIDPTHSGHTNILETYEEGSSFTATASPPNNPCPPGWRPPTKDEWVAAIDTLGLTTCSSNCTTKLATSTLKLPSAGIRNLNTGGVIFAGTYGYYWSGSPGSTQAYRLIFEASSVTPDFSTYRAYGLSLRCIRQESIACGDTVNFTYLGAPATYGSVAVGGQCWMDRNLGATQVATSATDYLSYGDLFQWGRLSDGHQVRTSATTTTLSSTDVPGHAKFIYGMGSPHDWRSPQNDLLWNATTVPAGSDGLWDFSLFDRSAAPSTSYCLRVVKSGGALLNTYSYVPEITMAAGDPVGGTSRMGSFTFKGNIKMQGSVKFAGSFVCGDPVNFTYLGAPAEYGSVALGGQCWMDRNLGATQVATSATDYLAYGDLFQWGRLSDGHQVRTSATTSALSSSNRPGHSSFIYGMGSPYDWRSPQNDLLWNATTSPNNPCPPGWRPPTQAEWASAINALGLTDCSSGCHTKLATSTLKLPNAGYRDRSTGAVSFAGAGGFYWSGSPLSTYAYFLYFNAFNVIPANFLDRAIGLSLRCIHIDTFVCGDPVSFTYMGQDVTYDSVPVGGECFMDRNLGATQVATSATDYLSYGDLFQWGRPADGHQARTSATTSSLSSSDVPGHASFILAPNSPYDWRSPQNDLLWNATTSPNNPCPPGWRPPTKDEWVAAISALGLTTCSSDCLNKLATSTLKLPSAGYRDRATGAVSYAGSYGRYWSGSPYSTYAYDLGGNPGIVDPASYFNRAYGFSLRCLRY